MADVLDIVVASDDLDFRRLAVAMLAGQGHRAHPTRAEARRTRHLVTTKDAEVLVWDADGEAGTQLITELENAGRHVGLVAVSAEGTPAGPGMPGVTQEASVEEISRAVGQAAAASRARMRRPRGARRLHVVRDDDEES